MRWKRLKAEFILDKEEYFGSSDFDLRLLVYATGYQQQPESPGIGGIERKYAFQGDCPDG